MNLQFLNLNKNIKILIIFLTILIILMSVYLLVLSKNRPTKPIPSPSPSNLSPVPTLIPYSSGGPLPDHSYTYSSQADVTARQQGEKVAQLIEKTPYQGNNFSLTYSFSTYGFTLTLVKGQEAAGNQEFDNFLKDNQIENRSWINNLVVVSK